MDKVMASRSNSPIQNPKLIVLRYRKEAQLVYTLDTKVGELLKDPDAVEIAERYVPGIVKNPMVGLVKGRTLRSLLAMPQAKKAGVTEDIVQKVLDEINEKK